MSEVVLEMKNVTKRFPGVIALKEVSIAVEKGEVMAICGENGAGKSTLMKVLSGSYSHKEYEGEIWINGKREEFSCISDAERCGIEMVYQELNMILVASVAENLYVGNLPGNGAFVDWKKLYADTRKILESVDMGHIDPRTPAGMLNSGQLQMLAIMRAVLKKPKIIVLDEPTSSLTDNETETLFRMIRQLKKSGVATRIIVSGQKPEAILGEASVSGLRAGGEDLPFDGVFIFREAAALSALLPGLEMDGAFIRVDRRMQTNLPGVFAAGDCTGLPLQVAKAVGEGCVAAISAATA